MQLTGSSKLSIPLRILQSYLQGGRKNLSQVSPFPSVEKTDLLFAAGKWPN